MRSIKTGWSSAREARPEDIEAGCAIFSEEYNVDASFVQVCRPAFSLGRAEIATASAGINRASFLPRTAALLQLEALSPASPASRHTGLHLQHISTCQTQSGSLIAESFIEAPQPERDGIKSPG
jgi:hypothetical protein